MSLRPQRRLLWVDNLRERQVARTARRDKVPRGESFPARRSEIRRRRCTALRDDESAPSPSLKVPKPEFLLEFLVIALDAPAQLGDVDQLLEGDVDRKVGGAVLGWGFLVARPIDQQPLFVLASQASSHAGEPRLQPFGRTFPPSDRLPGTFGERKGKLPDTDEIRVVSASDRGSASRFWAAPASPYQRARLDCGDISQTQGPQFLAQIAVTPVPGVHQHDPTWNAARKRAFDLRERNLRFGHEANRRWNTNFAAAFAVLSPFLRQVQTIGNRQAGRVVGYRQRHRRLAIGLSAKLPAVLRSHANRMPSLLGKRSIIDDPGFDLSVPLDRRQYQLAHLGQHALVGPIRFAHKMKQRLMLRRCPIWRCHRSDRLDALTLTRSHQPDAIILKRPLARRMPDHVPELADIRLKTRPTLTKALEIHRSLPLPECESPQYDTHAPLALRPADSVRCS